MDKGITYGIFTAIGLIVYFLVMKMFGLETVYWLRVFNVFIMIGGIFWMLNNQIRRGKPGVGYFGGLGLGVRLTLTAVILFVIFLAIYGKIINPNFVNSLESSQLWGADVTTDQVVVGILIEGVVSGVVITFILMQFFKGYIHPRDDA